MLGDDHQGRSPYTNPGRVAGRVPMAIRFTCDHCGVQIRVGDEAGGRDGKCPRCKKSVRVPATSSTDTSPPGPTSNPAPVPTPAEATSPDPTPPQDADPPQKPPEHTASGHKSKPIWDGGAMKLTNEHIIELNKRGDILIEPFDPKKLQDGIYDLHVGLRGATTSGKALVNIMKSGYLMLEQGDFCIVEVLETIRISPQYTVRFRLKADFAQRGLGVTTGPHTAAGYHGRLVLGLTNLTPAQMPISYNTNIATVEFRRLERAATVPCDTTYEGMPELRQENIEFITENPTMSTFMMLTALDTLNKNVVAGTAEVKSFKWVILVIMGISILLTCILFAGMA